MRVWLQRPRWRLAVVGRNEVMLARISVGSDSMAETEWWFDASGDAVGGFGWASSLASKGIRWLKMYDVRPSIVLGSAHNHFRIALLSAFHFGNP